MAFIPVTAPNRKKAAAQMPYQNQRFTKRKHILFRPVKNTQVNTALAAQPAASIGMEPRCFTVYIPQTQDKKQASITLLINNPPFLSPPPEQTDN